MEASKKTARTRKSKNSGSSTDVDSSAMTGMAPQTLMLPADLRIGMAAAIYGEFCATNPISPLTIDASAVAKIDAAGIQAVMAGLLPRAKAANWVWHAPTETFVRAARLLGLHQSMALPA